ncbi:hypothetical protein BDV26DRAFT_271600 [Aspergillus bertholletiae]|uniref:Uncharacterized protein n=1 Tax=Aspergillus bertholletiae TaxID=1226010 RepID=A0A5N7AUV5_9EURO|nr:hypothetical protein BDV26DRAFT_271600 [Aspergillus bertholletiae]
MVFVQIKEKFDPAVRPPRLPSHSFIIHIQVVAICILLSLQTPSQGSTNIDCFLAAMKIDEM